MEIWINPACSKCRTAVRALEESGVTYTERRYLEDPPSAAELEAVLTRLGLEPWDIARTGEPVARELGLADYGRAPADRSRWIAAMVAHPILIQRPIITADDGTTVVARDPETLERVVPRRRDD